MAQCPTLKFHYSIYAAFGGREIIMIYLLEDDASIRELVLYSLNSMGMDAQGFERPSEMNKAMNERIPDLLLLDIMLPEEDGFSILRRLRAEKGTKTLPVIVLTAKNTEFDTVTALDLGADDYISKPFGVMELIARVKAVLRRAGAVSPSADTGNTLSEGEVTVDTERHSVKAAGAEVILTLKEFELLCMLLKNKGIVLTRDKILSQVWGYDFDGENRTVDVHVRSLRTKLGDHGAIIETVRGVGYKIGR